MEVHRRRNPNAQRPNEEQPAVQNDQLPNLLQHFYSAVWTACAWVLDKIRDFAVELFTILWPLLKKILMSKIIKLFVVIMTMLFTKTTVVAILCESPVSGLGYIDDFCKSNSDANGTGKQLPLQSRINESLSLAERLANTDISMNIKLSNVELSLSDLKGRIAFSDLDKTEKDQFYQMIEQIKDSAQTTKNGIRKMLITFNNALYGLATYAENLHKHLTNQRSIVSRLIFQPKPTEVAIIPEQFLRDLDKLTDTIGIAYNMSEHVNSNLASLNDKVSKMEIMAGDLRCIREEKIKDHDKAGMLAKLYRHTLGDGDMNKITHQKNIAFLEQFTEYRREAQRQIQNVIDQLEKYKHIILTTRETASRLDAVQKQPLDIHLDELKNAIKKLTEYYERFDRNLTEYNQM
ncbi:unnamed protein product [Adineta ricciae]|uniref:Uncharacterized protein n=1 Tax=Adineta ricciae TaxID=249248 RepID=A0A815GS91_ADIRI|nr:unnamed protein product [Adineta ricciae]CAF1342092.1 unnamed protein product [Adineta ricciae]